MVVKEVVLDFCWAIWWQVPDFPPELLWTSGCCPLSTFLISSWCLIFSLLSQAWCQKEKRKKKCQIARVLLQSSGESMPLCRVNICTPDQFFWLRSSRHLYGVLQTWGQQGGKGKAGGRGADQSPPPYTLATILRLKYIYVRCAACEPVHVAAILTRLSTGICLIHVLWWN